MVRLGINWGAHARLRADVQRVAALAQHWYQELWDNDRLRDELARDPGFPVLPDNLPQHIIHSYLKPTATAVGPAALLTRSAAMGRGH